MLFVTKPAVGICHRFPKPYVVRESAYCVWKSAPEISFDARPDHAEYFQALHSSERVQREHPSRWFVLQYEPVGQFVAVAALEY